MSVDDEVDMTKFTVLPGVEESLSKLLSNSPGAGLDLSAKYGDATVEMSCIIRLIRPEGDFSFLGREDEKRTQNTGFPMRW